MIKAALTVVLAVGLAGCGDWPAEKLTSDTTSRAAPTTHNRELDIVPQTDGIYRVSDGGFLSTGIMSGHIQTMGPRPNSNHCSWARLSGPTMTIENTIDGGMVDAGPVEVRIDKTDYAFFSDGCWPWNRP